MKTITKLLITAAIAVFSMTSCFNDEWDFGKVDTDNIVVADTIVAPLGKIIVSAEDLIGGIGDIDIPIDIQVSEVFEYNMDSSLEGFLSDALSTEGEFHILSYIENNTDVQVELKTEFFSETGEGSNMPAYTIAPRSSKNFEEVVTFEQFERMVDAEKLEVTVTSDLKAGTITVANEDNIQARLTLRKTGGIKID